MKSKQLYTLICASNLVFCCASIGSSALAATAFDRATLQATIDQAENNYKSGKTDVAIEQAKSLLGTKDNSFLQSDEIARAAKADLAVFQVKAGHPEEGARMIRELLLTLQLESPMDPRYLTEPAVVYAEAPKDMKQYFGKLVTRLNESANTKLILDSLVDNTVPKDYSARLSAYCKRVQSALKPLDDFKTTADSEELKYGDPLSSLNAEDSDSKTDPRLSAANLDKMAAVLHELATEAQQMPVGDARPAIGLYRVVLLANSAQRYEQAEKFARQSISHVKALTDDIAGLPDIQLALAYALSKQDKKDEFKVLKEELLRNSDSRDRMLFAIARLTETTGDTDGALAVYKKALENRKNRGDNQQPEWIDCYNELLKKNTQN